MRAWSSPEVPRLPHSGPAVRLHDTASGRLVETDPEGPARLYVCGITPYDATHIGHAATYVAFDLLNRAWRAAGHDVTYVQNVTDVDDPLLERATLVGVDWAELAERETELFRQDMAALRVLAPDHYVGAVESIPWVIELIEELRGTGSVYQVDTDLYFSVTADPAFGEISGLSRDEMLAIFPERGGDPDREGKKDPLDCVLWRGERPGEPSWESPFGRGRPGWHIECTAIAERHLGSAFDVQAGGSDLVFVSHLRNSDVDPMAIRLVLLRHHYRTDWEWTDAELWDATDTLQRWRRAVETGPGVPAGPVVEEVLAALADDLDAPRAVAAIEAWVSATLGTDGSGDTSDPGAGEAIRRVADAALGLAL